MLCLDNNLYQTANLLTCAVSADADSCYRVKAATMVQRLRAVPARSDLHAAHDAGSESVHATDPAPEGRLIHAGLRGLRFGAHDIAASDIKPRIVTAPPILSDRGSYVRTT